MARHIHASPNVHNGNTEVLSWSSENIFFSRGPVQCVIYMLSREYVYLPLWYCKNHVEIDHLWDKLLPQIRRLERMHVNHAV